MGRSEQKNLDKNAAQANALSQSYGAQAQPLFSTLSPLLTEEATRPEGYSPTDLNAMRTGAMQSIGGSTAGIVGQGNLAAARTRNVGGSSAALDEAARTGDRELSSRNLDIDQNNARLREAHRQAGISGLSQLYGGLTEDQLRALGISNSAYSDAANANHSGFGINTGVLSYHT